jgi:hypothetical protein
VAVFLVGVILLVVSLNNRRMMANPVVARYPASRYIPRMNVGIAVCGVALIVLGLITRI